MPGPWRLKREKRCNAERLNFSLRPFECTRSMKRVQDTIIRSCRAFADLLGGIVGGERKRERGGRRSPSAPPRRARRSPSGVAARCEMSSRVPTVVCSSRQAARQAPGRPPDSIRPTMAGVAIHRHEAAAVRLRRLIGGDARSAPSSRLRAASCALAGRHLDRFQAPHAVAASGAARLRRGATTSCGFGTVPRPHRGSRDGVLRGTRTQDPRQSRG